MKGIGLPKEGPMGNEWKPHGNMAQKQKVYVPEELENERRSTWNWKQGATQRGQGQSAPDNVANPQKHTFR